MTIYQRPRDWSDMPFKTNGTGLALSIVAASDAFTAGHLNFPILPSWIYFAGILLGFVVHTNCMTLQSDVDWREKRKSTMDFIEKIDAIENAPQEILLMKSNIMKMIDSRSKHDLTPQKVSSIEKINANVYFLSLFAFSSATAFSLYFLS